VKTAFAAGARNPRHRQKPAFTPELRLALWAVHIEHHKPKRPGGHPDVGIWFKPPPFLDLRRVITAVFETAGYETSKRMLARTRAVRLAATAATIFYPVQGQDVKTSSDMRQHPIELGHESGVVRWCCSAAAAKYSSRTR
jgi:hypothetical protein